MLVKRVPLGAMPWQTAMAPLLMGSFRAVRQPMQRAISRSSAERDGARASSAASTGGKSDGGLSGEPGVSMAQTNSVRSTWVEPLIQVLVGDRRR